MAVIIQYGNHRRNIVTKECLCGPMCQIFESIRVNIESANENIAVMKIQYAYSKLRLKILMWVVSIKDVVQDTEINYFL